MKKFIQKPYYTMSSSASLMHLNSSENGLNDFEADGRLNAFGKNALPQKTDFLIFLIVWENSIFFRKLHSKGSYTFPFGFQSTRHPFFNSINGQR